MKKLPKEKKVEAVSAGFAGYAAASLVLALGATIRFFSRSADLNKKAKEVSKQIIKIHGPEAHEKTIKSFEDYKQKVNASLDKGMAEGKKSKNLGRIVYFKKAKNFFKKFTSKFEPLLKEELHLSEQYAKAETDEEKEKLKRSMPRFLSRNLS